MLRVFLFRHGETEWNQKRRFQGHTDIPLNDKGRQQALSLQLKVRQLNWKHVLCSDLSRAQETARIATESTGLPIFLDSRLREMHLGEVEGMTQEEIMEKYGDDFVLRWRSIEIAHDDFSFPRGETKRIHRNRVREAIREHALESGLKAGDQIGVSTHGGTLVRVIHSCLGAPRDAISIPNCVMYEVNLDLEENTWHFVGLL